MSFGIKSWDGKRREDLIKSATLCHDTCVCGRAVTGIEPYPPNSFGCKVRGTLHHYSTTQFRKNICSLYFLGNIAAGDLFFQPVVYTWGASGCDHPQCRVEQECFVGKQ